jgi:hypothetical protein
VRDSVPAKTVPEQKNAASAAQAKILNMAPSFWFKSRTKTENIPRRKILQDGQKKKGAGAPEIKIRRPRGEVRLFLPVSHQRIPA